MARLLHVIETLGLGGAERLLALAVRKLKRTAHTNIVVHLLDTPRDWRASIEDDGIAVESLQLASPYDAVGAIAGVRRLVRRWRIDIVHTHLYFPNLYGQFAGRLEGIPVVSSLHNLEFEPGVLRDNTRFTPGKQRLFRTVARGAVRIARPTLVAVSDAVRASATRQLNVAADSVITIHNGIEPDAVPAPDRAAARTRLGVPADAYVLTTVGRLVPLKGVRYLLEALPVIRAAAPGTVLLVVGAGPRREALEELARTHGVTDAVRFLGAGVALAESALEAADVFVAPSLSEGFGLTVLEAMAMARPCVASRTGGLPEIVEDEGSGLLVPPADPRALAAALVRLAGDLATRERFGRRGREIVVTRFDIADTARRLAALYDTIVARDDRRTEPLDTGKG
jgi:glycosyltransferase involved in cell wall biosynthesis